MCICYPPPEFRKPDIVWELNKSLHELWCQELGGSIINKGSIYDKTLIKKSMGKLYLTTYSKGPLEFICSPRIIYAPPRITVTKTKESFQEGEIVKLSWAATVRILTNALTKQRVVSTRLVQVLIVVPFPLRLEGGEDITKVFPIRDLG
jgi:hypothetical protein